MYEHRGRGGSRGGWIWCLAITAGTCAPSWADVIILRGGGEIQGKVISDPKKPDTLQVLLLNGRNPITFQKKQILQVVPKASPLDAYLVKREHLAPTAQAAFDLGIWCEQNKLDDLARLHFETAISYDKDFAPAHKKLGHVQHGNRWLTLDELRSVQGLVKYHGQWITPEEKSKRDEKAKLSASQFEWMRRIRVLRQSVVAGSSQGREAEAQFLRIHEPEAVVPLVRVLGNDEPPFRQLLAQALGKISGKESARALVNMILAEVQSDVRTTVLDQLKERDEPAIVSQLIKALRVEDVRIINRAAWTLGNLGVDTAVPPLISALVTTEEHIVLVNEGQVANPGATMGPGPALMGLNSNWAAYLTGPTVGPGVVAYGATSVPYFGSVPLLPGVGVMGGGGGGGSGRGPTPKAVTFTYQNTEVLAALNRLTGKDFGYDTAAWRRWMKLSFNPHPNPVRQVPQP